MTPVCIRGTVYRSIAAAAIGERVNPKTVHKHLDAGTPHLIGLANRTAPRPCELDGIAYPSLTAAAMARGVSLQAVSQRVASSEGSR